MAEVLKDFTQEKPAKLTFKGRSSSPVQLSINTSPARTTTFIPSPTSPAKSLSGAIMENTWPVSSTISKHPLTNSTDPRKQFWTHQSISNGPSPTRSYLDPDSSDQESPKRTPAPAKPHAPQKAIPKARQAIGLVNGRAKQMRSPDIPDPSNSSPAMSDHTGPKNETRAFRVERDMSLQRVMDADGGSRGQRQDGLAQGAANSDIQDFAGDQRRMDDGFTFDQPTETSIPRQSTLLTSSVRSRGDPPQFNLFAANSRPGLGNAQGLGLGTPPTTRPWNSHSAPGSALNVGSTGSPAQKNVSSVGVPRDKNGINDWGSGIPAVHNPAPVYSKNAQIASSQMRRADPGHYISNLTPPKMFTQSVSGFTQQDQKDEHSFNATVAASDPYMAPWQQRRDVDKSSDISSSTKIEPGSVPQHHGPSAPYGYGPLMNNATGGAGNNFEPIHVTSAAIASMNGETETANAAQTTGFDDFTFWTPEQAKTGDALEAVAPYELPVSQADIDPLEQYLQDNSRPAYAFDDTEVARLLPQASVNTWGSGRGDYWANVLGSRPPSQAAVPAPTFTGQGQGGRFSPSIKDRILSVHGMTLRALAQESNKTQATQDYSLSLPHQSGVSYGDFVQPSPTRPQRPHSDVDSFIMHHPGDGFPTAYPQQPFNTPPTAYSPSAPLFEPYQGVAVSTDVPTQVEPRGRTATSEKKQVHMAPPPIRLDDSTFVPPEQFTPFPFPRPRVASEPVSPSPAAAPSATPDDVQPGSRPRSTSRGRKPSKRRSNPYSVHAAPVSSATAGAERLPLLTLFVRRRQAPNARRQAQVELPRWAFKTPAPAAPATASPSPKSLNDKYFASLEYDDQVLFAQLRAQYHGVLLGEHWPARAWRRWLSARTLKRVRVVALPGGGVPSRREETPERELLDFFRRPRRGIARYSWVHWAQKLVDGAAAPGSLVPASPLLPIPDPALLRHSHTSGDASLPAQSPRVHQIQRGDAESKAHEPEKRADQHDAQGLALEFVEGWSAPKVLAAVLLVVLIAAAACVVWVFFGPEDPVGASIAAERLADERVSAYANSSMHGHGSSGTGTGTGSGTVSGTAGTAALQLQGGRLARVGTGLLLSVAVLLGGWTGVAAWVWLSWLVM